MAIIELADSRIANSSRTWQQDCDVDVTGWTKANEFILATWVQSTEPHGNITKNYKLQWRRVGGTWADVASTGEIAWGTGTVLVDAFALVVGVSSGCNTWDRGFENEGDNSCDLRIDAGDYSEIQWALDPSGAIDSQQYEFRLVNVTDTVNGPTCNAQITTAAGVTTNTFDRPADMTVYIQPTFDRNSDMSVKRRETFDRPADMTVVNRGTFDRPSDMHVKAPVVFDRPAGMHVKAPVVFDRPADMTVYVQPTFDRTSDMEVTAPSPQFDRTSDMTVYVQPTFDSNSDMTVLREEVFDNPSDMHVKAPVVFDRPAGMHVKAPVVFDRPAGMHVKAPVVFDRPADMTVVNRGTFDRPSDMVVKRRETFDLTSDMFVIAPLDLEDVLITISKYNEIDMDPENYNGINIQAENQNEIEMEVEKQGLEL